MVKLLRYIKDYKKECVLGPLFKLLEACFDLTVPIVMAWMIDRGIAENDLPFIGKMGALLLLLACTKVLFPFKAHSILLHFLS